MNSSVNIVFLGHIPLQSYIQIQRWDRFRDKRMGKKLSINAR